LDDRLPIVQTYANGSTDRAGKEADVEADLAERGDARRAAQPKHVRGLRLEGAKERPPNGDRRLAFGRDGNRDSPGYRPLRRPLARAGIDDDGALPHVDELEGDAARGGALGVGQRDEGKGQQRRHLYILAEEGRKR
jgi:hypothetical protein